LRILPYAAALRYESDMMSFEIIPNEEKRSEDGMMIRGS
jgi:hypothetical protein